MKNLVLTSLLIFILSCGTSVKRKYEIGADNPRKNFYSTINNHFNLVDSLREKNLDTLETLNRDFLKILKDYKDTIFNLTDTSNYDLIYLSKSDDKNLCLVSWDTRMGGTMIDFATVAIYKTSSETKITYLYDVESSLSNTLKHYDTVVTVSIGQKRMYLAHGFGQGSTALPMQEVRAFKIFNDTLINPVVFPESQSNISIYFDTHAFKENESIPVIKIRDFGKKILIPQSKNKDGFSGKYKVLNLKDSIYVSD